MLALKLLLAALLSAAEPHQWIVDGGFRNAAGQTCCGKQHCKVVREGQVRYSATGADVIHDDGTSSWVGKPYIRPSQDGQYWYCTMGCLFIPSGA